MKIFIDSADIAEIQEAASMGVLDGVTTNPTLVAKTGRKYLTVLEDIAKIVDGPISAETISLDCKGMMEEAKVFAKIHPNITIKIAMGTEGLKAVKLCVEQGIKTNVTLVFSASQALLVAKAGATFVSPFVGRLDDISEDGMKLIADIKTIYKNYHFKTEILVASVRHPIHFVQAALLGADVATLPLAVIRQLTKHPLTDIGIQRFLEDHKKIPK